MDVILKYPYAEKIAQSVPLFVLFFAFLVSDLLHLAPPLGLGYGILFYWTIYRPDLIPLKGLFVVGLILDGVMGRDLGLSFLQFLFVFTLVLSQRSSFFQVPFSVMWVGFLFFMALCLILIGGVQYGLEGKIAYETLLFSFLWVGASYPILSLFLIKIHHFLT